MQILFLNGTIVEHFVKLLLLRTRHWLFCDCDAFPSYRLYDFWLTKERMNKLIGFAGPFAILTSITFFFQIDVHWVAVLFVPHFPFKHSSVPDPSTTNEHSTYPRCDVCWNAFKKGSHQEASSLQLDFNLLASTSSWI